MSFDWGEYLDIAIRLHDSPLISAEASDRTAASRAYYAAFNLAADGLEAKHEWRRQAKASDHGELANFLKRFGNTPKGRAGLDLERLYTLRVKADYSAVVQDPAKLALTAIQLAQQIKATISKF